LFVKLVPFLKIKYVRLGMRLSGRVLVFPEFEPLRQKKANEIDNSGFVFYRDNGQLTPSSAYVQCGLTQTRFTLSLKSTITDRYMKQQFSSH
jgi:hypothetical protein